MIGIPSNRGIDGLCTLSLAQLYRTGRAVHDPLIHGGAMPIPRMLIVHEFLKSSCDWLMFWDDDIGAQPSDWDLLMEQREDELAVCAEYVKRVKDHNYVAAYGLGFARIHRDAFAMIRKLGIPKGDYFGVPIEGFFPIGFAHNGKYLLEDHGFWSLCYQAKVPLRVERRTRLFHVGSSRWIYDPRTLEPEPQLVTRPQSGLMADEHVHSDNPANGAESPAHLT